MRAALPGDTLPVLCCKFGQVQVHVALSNQHICKKTKKNKKPPPTPPAQIAISPFPSSAFRSHDFHVFFFRIKVSPSCAATGTGLNGFKMREWLCVFVTRFSQVPGLTLFLSRFAPGASFLFSPRPPPPQPASSLPDAPLSLQGPADCLLAATGS